MARSIAVLKLSHKVKNVITFAQSVATAMTGNASFPSPTPTLATLEADIAALNTAETAVLARSKGAAEARNAKFAVLRADLETLRTYVQAVADAANPSNAAAIVEGAGLSVRKVTRHDKPALAAEQGSVSGSVNLVMKSAGRKAAYNWQYSTDQKTWTSLPQTLKAKTGAIGLTTATVYYFRSAAQTEDAAGEFGQVVSLLVK